jgi:hypothetical protein
VEGVRAYFEDEHDLDVDVEAVGLENKGDESTEEQGMVGDLLNTGSRRKR